MVMNNVARGCCQEILWKTDEKPRNIIALANFDCWNA
jgi:hypothetical protein